METNELSIVITTFKSELKIFTCLDAIPSNIKTIVVENSNNESFKKDIEKKLLWNSTLKKRPAFKFNKDFYNPSTFVWAYGV